MTNPYQAPTSTLSDTSISHAIDQLDVSETWKKRFKLIERAGGVRMPNFKLLTFKERMQANFDILAFFFGPIYFLIKGLWQQALTLLTIIFAIAIASVLLGFDQHIKGVGYGLGAVFAIRANVGYYSRKVLGHALRF